jgi:hypothetical protein
MKTQFTVLVTVTNDGLDRSEATIEATRAILVYCQIKNQHGCAVSENKLTFSVQPGAVELAD